jgi:cytidylate kinase
LDISSVALFELHRSKSAQYVEHEEFRNVARGKKHQISDLDESTREVPKADKGVDDVVTKVTT